MNVLEKYTGLPKEVDSLLAPQGRAKLEHVLASKNIILSYARMQVEVANEFGDVTHLGLYRCQQTDLVQFFPVICGSENLYHQLQKFSWYYSEDKNEYTVAAKHILDGASVLEIGCGSGHFASKIPHAHFFGLEFNTLALQKCQQKGLQVSHQSIEAYAKVNEACFDVVCAFQVLEHISHPYNFLSSMLSCLKPGGKLIFSVPAEDSFVQKIPTYTLNLPPHHVTRWSNTAIKSLEKIFPLNIIELHMDSLQLEHFQHYATNMARYMACCELGFSHICLSTQQFEKVINLSHKFIPLFFEKAQKEHQKINGHDVVAVFVKK